MSNVPHSSDSRRPTGALAMVVAGAALLAGIGETSVILLARVILDRYTLLNPQAIWLNPIVYMAAFALPISLVSWLGWRTGGSTRALRWSVFVGATLAILAVFTVLKDRLHVLALTAVAVGISARVAAFVASDPQRFMRWAPRGVSGLATLSLLGAIGFNGSRAWWERMGAPPRLSGGGGT